MKKYIIFLFLQLPLLVLADNSYTNYTFNNSDLISSHDGYNNQVMDVNQFKKEFKNDRKMFKKQYPDESKIIDNAISKLSGTKNITSYIPIYGLVKTMSKLPNLVAIDVAANAAYIDAKSQGMSGADAIRAWGAVYINKVNSNEESTMQQENAPVQQPDWSNDNW